LGYITTWIDHKALVVEAQEGFDDVQSRLKGLIERVESFK
jgi:hypothetical protein